jgi:hypothetical protein
MGSAFVDAFKVGEGVAYWQAELGRKLIVIRDYVVFENGLVFSNLDREMK